MFMTVSIFVQNMSLSAAGRICRNACAYEFCKTLAQGSADKYFLSLGQQIEAEGGSAEIAERSMYLLGDIINLVALSFHVYSDIQDSVLIEIVDFFEARIRHNWEKLLCG